MCRQYFQISTVQPLTGYLHLLWGWHSVDWQSRECYVRIEAIVYRAFEFRLTQEHIVSVSIRSVSVPRHSVVKRHQTFIMGCVRLHTTWVERDNDTREGEGREKWGTEEGNKKHARWKNDATSTTQRENAIYCWKFIGHTPKLTEIYDDIRPKDFHFCTALILSAYLNHLNITKGHMQETASDQNKHTNHTIFGKVSPMTECGNKQNCCLGFPCDHWSCQKTRLCGLEQCLHQLFLFWPYLALRFSVLSYVKSYNNPFQPISHLPPAIHLSKMHFHPIIKPQDSIVINHRLQYQLRACG